jgi:hypothetical protein
MITSRASPVIREARVQAAINLADPRKRALRDMTANYIHRANAQQSFQQ